MQLEQPQEVGHALLVDEPQGQGAAVVEPHRCISYLGAPAPSSRPVTRSILGVSRQRAHQLAQQDGFPEPVARLKVGRIWRTARTPVSRFDHRHQAWPLWSRQPS